MPGYLSHTTKTHSGEEREPVKGLEAQTSETAERKKKAKVRTHSENIFYHQVKVKPAKTSNQIQYRCISH